MIFNDFLAGGFAYARAGESARSKVAVRVAEDQICGIERAGRASDTAMFRAAANLVRGRSASALAVLGDLMAKAPAGPAGWLIPIEPLFASLREDAGFAAILAQLAARAR